ncbi:hypothetical protein ACJJTC_009821 [Scirpophaga incertulas]
MEKRKDFISTLKMCRFCLSRDESLSSLYLCKHIQNKTSKGVPLSLKILACISVEVFPSDKMLSYICKRCKYFMDLFYEYKQICRTADERILQYVQNGTTLEKLVWPASLMNIFHYSIKNSGNTKVVETLLKGGTTIQVTSQGSNSDEEDEDDDNVYDIKIAGQSSDGTKCIEVTSKSDIASSKTKSKQQGYTSVPKLARHVRSHAGDRPYPCKFCDKSFMKSHHYTRHVRMKHRESFRAPRPRRSENYRCEQCEEVFGTQDELIYHSAIHATQNLTCPLCQEKFEDVDAVTAHIKSHVNGMEFMCDLCELIFTSKEKLDNHLTIVHADEIAQELGQDESSMELDGEDDDDDNSINVKEEDGEMVVEIKKCSEFLTQTDSGDKAENTNSEGSESETIYSNLPPIETVAMVQKDTKEIQNAEKSTQGVIKAPISASGAVTITAVNCETATILKKAEEMKRKLQQAPSPVTAKKEKSNNKVESSTGGASDKSLRLLEKELQELKRTITRSEPAKSQAKSVESIRNRRPQLFTSTPKARQVEEKKLLAANKLLAQEKRSRTIMKDNKESKEIKESKIVAKEDKEKELKDMKDKEAKEKERKEKELKEKELKEKEQKQRELKEREQKESELKEREEKEQKELKEQEQKDKEIKENDLNNKEKDVNEIPKDIVKNGTSNKNQQEEKKCPEKVPSEMTPQCVDKNQPEEVVRRSNRPSKIKDYARMLKNKAQTKSDEEFDDDDDEPKDKLESTTRSRSRRMSVKSPESARYTTRRHFHGAEKKGTPAQRSTQRSGNEAKEASNSEIKEPTGVLISPTGQALKKVSLNALPPGIKRLPLPMSARPITSGELCEMAKLAIKKL